MPTTSSREEELRPCPFCGGDNLKLRHSKARGGLRCILIVCWECLGTAPLGVWNSTVPRDDGSKVGE